MVKKIKNHSILFIIIVTIWLQINSNVYVCVEYLQEGRQNM